ncbi:MAG TPA: tRNA (guanine(46)-N(7))-methyltransferase TrmB [Stellaceae bacterium]
MDSPTTRANSAAPQRRLYGRRRGRALRAGQRALVETLLPQLRFALPAGGAPLDPRHLFGSAVREIWFEIGFGGGEHLAFQAATHSDCGHIGSEVFEPGIARLLAEIDSRKLGNVRLFVDDARLLIAALAPQSLDRAFVLFPDPWPKERHKKRRIVSRETLDALAAALRDGAELRVATDDADYAQWIDERLAAHADFVALDPVPRPADWPATRYEQKAAAQGRPARLFFYRRRAR